MANFPTTPILDNFNRADSTLTLGSNWITSFDLSGISSNKAYCPAIIQGFSLDTWNVSTFGSDYEAFATISTKMTAGIEFDLFGANGSGQGYGIAVYTDHIDITIQNSGGTSLGASITNTLNNGDVVGFSKVGSTITAYVNGTSIGSRTDATYNDSGISLSMILADTTIRIDDFGGGQYRPLTRLERTPIRGVGRGIFRP